MIIFINENKYKFDKKDLNDMYIGEGKEGTVYRYNNEAVKIYDKFSNKERLDEDTCKYLTNIDTKRILLPRRLIYNEDNKFIGYTTEFHQKYYINNIARMKLKELKKDLEIIKNDIVTLSKNNVSINDFYLDNFILSDGLYFVDPGSYYIDDNNRYLYNENLRKMNDFLCEYILARVSNIPKKKLQLLRDRLDYDEYISESLPSNNDSVQNYVKKLVI